jgi:hypothetical protein
MKVDRTRIVGEGIYSPLELTIDGRVVTLFGEAAKRRIPDAGYVDLGSDVPGVLHPSAYELPEEPGATAYLAGFTDAPAVCRA